MQGIIIPDKRYFLYLRKDQKETLLSELNYINSKIIKNKEDEHKFISSLELGFWHSLTKVMRMGFRWNQEKFLRILPEDLLKFCRLRNMVAHHENLLKINKAIFIGGNKTKIFPIKEQEELIQRINNAIKEWPKGTKKGTPIHEGTP